MRIWSVHPKYLDTKGLGGVWRETLLAKAVFEGKTKGYTKHPQLNRFRETSDPVKYISTYLSVVHEEASKRGFNYDGSKVGEVAVLKPVPVTKGQLEYEWSHLLKKLKKRSPEWLAKIPEASLPDTLPDTHPMFEVVEGGIASWEVLQAPQPKKQSRKRKSRPDNETTGEENENNFENGDEKSDSVRDSENLILDDNVDGKRLTRRSLRRSDVGNDQMAKSAAVSNVSNGNATASRAKKSKSGSEKTVKRRGTEIPNAEQPPQRGKKGRSSHQALEPTEQAERSKKGRSSRQVVEQTEQAPKSKKAGSSGRSKTKALP